MVQREIKLVGTEGEDGCQAHPSSPVGDVSTLKHRSEQMFTFPRIWTLLIRLNPLLSVSRLVLVPAHCLRRVSPSDHLFSVTVPSPGLMVIPALFLPR